MRELTADMAGTHPNLKEAGVIATTADREAGKARPRRRNALLWAAQILLAAVFVVAAMPKLAGATIINLAVLHSAAAALTVPLCAVFVLLAWSRRQQTRHLAAVIRR
jgi:hypothetical protein